jgi:hypothetical protein
MNSRVIALGRAALLVWVFRVVAQFGAEHDAGWVATATREACDAAQRAYIDVARAYHTTMDLGDCREMTVDDLGRLQPRPPAGDEPSAAEYYNIPRGTGNFPRRGPGPE